VDWVAAVHQGVVDPRRAVPGAESKEPGAFGFDFYFGEMETWFPHSSHVEWLDCTSCHGPIYRTREIDTSMAEIAAGESCGACHGTIAFAADVCERCHPAAALPEGRLTAKLENDLVFVRDTTTTNAQDMTSLAPSIFPHWRHRIEYACSACHPSLFPMEAGASEILMDDMQMGGTCGACHNGETAFGVMSCQRCHREPPEAIVAPEPAEEAPPQEVADAESAAETDDAPETVLPTTSEEGRS
jgi:c(7)-type cytochrome triheme protein